MINFRISLIEVYPTCVGGCLPLYFIPLVVLSDDTRGAVCLSAGKLLDYFVHFGVLSVYVDVNLWHFSPTCVAFSQCRRTQRLMVIWVIAEVYIHSTCADWMIFDLFLLLCTMQVSTSAG